MRLERPGLVRAAVADDRPNGDQRGALCFGSGGGNRFGNRLHVVALRDGERLPFIRLEALADILGEDEAGGARQRDMVVVVQVDQLAEPQMA